MFFLSLDLFLPLCLCGGIVEEKRLMIGYIYMSLTGLRHMKSSGVDEETIVLHSILDNLSLIIPSVPPSSHFCLWWRS
jgi:hypothetical protein